MKINVLLTLLVLSLSAQANDVIQTSKGKPIINVFTDFYTGFGAANNQRGFELNRCYLGYEYKLNPELTITGIVDFGQSQKVDDYPFLNPSLKVTPCSFSVICVSDARESNMGDHL